MTDGTVYCWGSGTSGEIGNGILSDTPAPTAVTGITTATALAASERFTCALLTDGTISCWGNNQGAQLGDGTVLAAGTPGAVFGY